MTAAELFHAARNTNTHARVREAMVIAAALEHFAEGDSNALAAGIRGARSVADRGGGFAGKYLQSLSDDDRAQLTRNAHLCADLRLGYVVSRIVGGCAQVGRDPATLDVEQVALEAGVWPAIHRDDLTPQHLRDDPRAAPRPA